MFLKKNRWCAMMLALASVLGFLAAICLYWGREKSPTRQQERYVARSTFSSALYRFLYQDKRIAPEAAIKSERDSGAHQVLTPAATSARAGSVLQPSEYPSLTSAKHSKAYLDAFNSRVRTDSEWKEPLDSQARPYEESKRNWDEPGKESADGPSRILRLPVGSKGNNAALSSTGLRDIIGADDNPFLAAIRDNFGDRTTAATASQTSSTGNTSPAQSSPPSPTVTNGNQETGRASTSRGESNPVRNNFYALIGDSGNHQLEMAVATKSGPQSFALEGSLAAVHFDSGLDFGPLQSVWFGKVDQQPFPEMVVTDKYLSLVYLYKGTAPGQFLSENVLYVPSSIISAAAFDINGDGEMDLIVGGRLSESELGNPWNIYIYLQQNGAFVYQRRIPLTIPLGAIHVGRYGDQIGILVVDQALVSAEFLWVDRAGMVLDRTREIPSNRHQDSRITVSNGTKPIWVRLAQFGNVSFVGSYDDNEFHLIGTTENVDPLPFMVIGDLRQNGQRRCWIHF